MQDPQTAGRDTVKWKPRDYVPCGKDEEEARAWVERLQRSNPTYWTTDRLIATLYAHRENHMASIERALAPEWEAAQRAVFDTGNSGWSQIAAEAIGQLREQLAASDQARSVLLISIDNLDRLLRMATTRAEQAEASLSVLKAELKNIAEADPSTWERDVRDQFRPWAQNRARHALAKVESSTLQPIPSSPQKGEPEKP